MADMPMFCEEMDIATLEQFRSFAKAGDTLDIRGDRFEVVCHEDGTVELKRIPTAKDMKKMLGYDPAAELAHVQAVVARYWPPNTITRYKDHVISEEHFEAEG